MTFSVRQVRLPRPENTRNFAHAPQKCWNYSKIQKPLIVFYWLTAVGGIVKNQADNTRFIKHGEDGYACVLPALRNQTEPVLVAVTNSPAFKYFSYFFS
jgi:hypothetical protein